MQNQSLQEILNKYKSLSNKELSQIVMGLKADFDSLKVHMLNLTETIGEIEEVYDKVLNELQKRMKFPDPQKPDNDRN